MAWRSREGKRLPREPMREMHIEAVERLFGTVEEVLADPALEFLSDNGETHIATETRAIALARVRQPINTPVYSPQFNGMAESFKRDYEARMDRHDARAVVKQTPGAFEHKVILASSS